MVSIGVSARVSSEMGGDVALTGDVLRICSTVACMGIGSCPACLRTLQEGPLEKIGPSFAQSSSRMRSGHLSWTSSISTQPWRVLYLSPLKERRLEIISKERFRRIPLCHTSPRWCPLPRGSWNAAFVIKAQTHSPTSTMCVVQGTSLPSSRSGFCPFPVVPTQRSGASWWPGLTLGS